MIDIVFQLLIFFLTTAQLAQQSRADIDLPQEQGEQTEVSQESGLIINITDNGDIIIGDQVVQLDQIESFVIDARRNAPPEIRDHLRPLVRADRNASSSRLNALLDVLKSAGIGGVRLATSPSQ